MTKVDLELRDNGQRAPTIVRRSWRGFASEHVLLPPGEIEFAWTGEVDYLALHDIKRTDGLTTLTDDKPRRLLDMRDRMTFAPRGTTVGGWSNLKRDADNFTALFFQAGFLAEELGVRAQSSLSKPWLYFDDPALLMSMQKLRKQLAAPDAPDATYTETLALVCALELGRMQGTADYRAVPRPGQLSRRHEKRLREYIDTHMHEPMGLDALASIVGLSRFHFVRAFKATFGNTPHQYVLMRRIDRALGLLRRTKTSLAGIAEQSGFSSQQQFTTIFRKVTGTTPGQYRRETE